jgi:hypothetical protein
MKCPQSEFENRSQAKFCKKPVWRDRLVEVVLLHI